MIKFNGLNHLAMVTADMDATIKYWRDLLGFRMVLTMGHPGYRHYFFEIAPCSYIAFFEWDGAEPCLEKDHGAPLKGPITFDHVSLGVEDKDSLWELKDRLEAAGFWASEVVDHGFIYSLYSFDPNNIPVEFSYNVPDVNIASCPIYGDKKPTQAAELGPEPQSGIWPEVTECTPPDERVTYPGQGKELFDND